MWESAARPASELPPLDKAALAEALAAFLAGLGYPQSGVTLLLGDDARLAALNRAWRGQEGPTDVLSWSYLEPGAPAPPLLGDLAVSVERAAAQAAENGWDVQTEVLRLLAHGCAHLAGYDHATDAEDAAMRAVEETLLARVGLEGLYPVDRAHEPGAPA